MYYVDQRLAQILSDNRNENAERQQHIAQRDHPARERIGLWLIARGERLARSKARIA